MSSFAPVALNELTSDGKLAECDASALDLNMWRNFLLLTRLTIRSASVLLVSSQIIKRLDYSIISLRRSVLMSGLYCNSLTEDSGEVIEIEMAATASRH
jgi:hypothetical protein